MRSYELSGGRAPGRGVLVPMNEKHEAFKNSSTLSVEYQRLYQQGEELQKDIETHLDGLTRDSSSKESLNSITIGAEELRDRTHSWFNEITIQVLPQTAFDRTHTYLLLRRITAAISSELFYEEYHGEWYTPGEPGIAVHNITQRVSPGRAKEEASDVMKQALRLIRTATTSRLSAGVVSHTVGHVANSAFILMWMNKGHPELVDVHQAVKEVFAEFRIVALRADEIQHQDRITDLILSQIEQSEFLFADLSGERPNVYYEVGYAHALRKHPILFRRSGTSLHFDLSIHNVPEYENVTQLRGLLRARLEAITGRVPPE
jgi:hypothetical protein